MKLTRIEIENFKGIGRRQTVEIRPVTLLFGRNNAGKSTILQALGYMRDILRQGRADLNVTTAGDLLDHGGFPDLVHKHDPDRAVVLKTVFDTRGSTHSFHSFLPVHWNREGISEADAEECDIRYLWGFRYDGDYPQYSSEGVDSVAVETEIRWNPDLKRAYISRLTLDMNEEPIVEIVSPLKNRTRQLLKIHYEHEMNRHPYNRNRESPFERRVRELAKAATNSPLISDKKNNAGTVDDVQVYADFLCLTVETKRDAMPFFDVHLNIQFRPLDGDACSEDCLAGESVVDRVLCGILNEQIRGPLTIARHYLSEMKYIGPVRNVPPREFSPRATADVERWSDGLAAWDLIYKGDDTDLIDNVNRWLSDENKLNTGYRFRREEFEEVPRTVDDEAVMEEAAGNGIDSGEFPSIPVDNPIGTRVSLHDRVNDVRVTPHDIGFGLSQLIPIVVGILNNHHGLLVIEEPEFHLHPVIQVAIGDLFIHSARKDSTNRNKDRLLIVETHSEHIILRILRRITEADEGELPSDLCGIDPEDLSVTHVGKGDEFTRIRRLRVTRQGGFLDHWPEGFFEERCAELF